MTHRNIKIGVTTAVLVLAFAGLLWSTLREGTEYYKHVDEVMSSPQAWQGKRREGALRQQLLSNPHSPDQYRVDGIVRNFDPWYKAFNVQPGDKLYLPPEQRVHVW